MRTTSEIKRICPFCGQTRYVTCREDDGIDWCGHHRGTPSSSIDDSGCTCPLGRLQHEKVKVKRMCMNCVYDVRANCTYNSDNVRPARIKDLTAVCNAHEFNIALLHDILDDTK